MKQYTNVEELPTITTDRRNSLKLYRDLIDQGAYIENPALELMSNQSFGIRAGYVFEFAAIFSAPIVKEKKDATIDDAMKLADNRFVHVLDQTIPFLFVDYLLRNKIRVGSLPQKWSFVVDSRHSDPRSKLALVTVKWFAEEESQSSCLIGGFRPLESKFVRARGLEHSSVEGSIFIFDKKITTAPR